MKIKNVCQLFKRRYTLMDLGIEIVSFNKEKGKKKTLYLIFKTTHERD